MQEFKLPDLGEGMHEAEVRRWLVKAGDTIKRDQPMVEVETDKAVIEIPSPVAGRVSSIRVGEGTVAQLGEVLVVFDTPSPSGAVNTPASAASSANAASSNMSGVSGSPKAALSSNVASPTGSTQPVAASVVVAQGTSANMSATAARHRVLAAPAVRKRAFELGIDIEQVTPSQASGRVTIEDVESYAEHARTASSSSVATPELAIPHVPSSSTSSTVASSQANGASKTVATSATPAPSIPLVAPSRAGQPASADERQALTGLRRRIAERMERSWRTIPHASAFDEVDASELVALRKALKPLAEQRGVRLTYMPLLIKLLLPALKEFPIFNASLDEEKREIIYKRSYHIGIAADSPEGLLVPVLRDADTLTLLEVARQLEHLIEGSQKRTLSLQEVSGSTFTLNNIGSFGGSSGTPIINYPEAAILAVGRLQEKAIVQNGTILARTMMPLTLSFDHRLIDGGMSGKFIARFKELVEHPQRLMLDMV